MTTYPPKDPFSSGPTITPEVSLVPSVVVPSLSLTAPESPIVNLDWDHTTRPRDIFLALCQKLVPYGMENDYYGSLLTRLGFQQDTHKNWIAERMAGEERSTTAFMAHLDTVGGTYSPIAVYVEDEVAHTGGQSILGADDRAGVAVLLHLYLNDIPGRYCLFVGEECGRIGSVKMAEELLAATSDAPHFLSGCLRAIQFDRRGDNSIVTHQLGIPTCSRQFADSLSNQLYDLGFVMDPDSTGVFTDSLGFIGSIPECTNLSVGYDGAHTRAEYQCLRFLDDIATSAFIIHWEALPAVRPLADGEDLNDALNRVPAFSVNQYFRKQGGKGYTKSYTSNSAYGDYLEGDGDERYLGMTGEELAEWTESYQWEGEEESEREWGESSFDGSQDEEIVGIAINSLAADILSGKEFGIKHLHALVSYDIDQTCDNIATLLLQIQDQIMGDKAQ